MGGAHSVGVTLAAMARNSSRGALTDPFLLAALIWAAFTMPAGVMVGPTTCRRSKGRTLFEVRDDDSIFVSIASYRDENCPKTLEEMYSKASRPDNLFVGLVQQVSLIGPPCVGSRSDARSSWDTTGRLQPAPVSSTP